MTLVVGMRGRREAVQSAVLLAAGALAVFLYLPVLYRVVRHPAPYINSDLAEPFLLVEDVLRDPSALLAWHQTTTLFAVPDWLFAGAVLQLPVANIWLPLAYRVLHLTVLAAVIAALVSTVDGRRFATALACTLAVMVGYGLVAMMFPAGLVGPALIMVSAGPYNHAGAALMALGAGACLMRDVQAPSAAGAGLWGMATAGLVVLGTGSDAILALWFTAPTLAALWLCPDATGRARRIRISGVLATGSVLGWLGSRLLVAGDYGGATVLESALRVARLAADALQGGDVALIAILAPIGLVIWRAGRHLWQRRAATPHQLGEVMLAGAAAATILGPICAAVVLDRGSLRYFQFLVPLAVTATTAGALRTPIAASASALRLGAAALLVAVLVGAPGAGWRAAKALTREAPLIACLERHDLRGGVGHYWTAKETIFRSGRAIHVIQITPGGEPYRWSFNERWFQRRADNGRPVDPNFVIVNRLGADTVRSLFGSPSRRVACASHTIWQYDRPLAPPDGDIR